MKKKNTKGYLLMNIFVCRKYYKPKQHN